MIAVHLYGDLAAKYGHRFEFEARDTVECLRALNANFPTFRTDIAKGQYEVFADNEYLGPEDLLRPVQKDVHIAPVTGGSFAALLAPLLGAIGITGVAATIVSGLILVGLMLGVSMLMAPKKQKKEEKPSSPEKVEGFAFGGPINVTEQGVAVPLLYGRCHAGSVVVSAGIDTVQMMDVGGTEIQLSTMRDFATPSPMPAEPPRGANNRRTS
jgi:predicted phage tail protein